MLMTHKWRAPTNRWYRAGQLLPVAHAGSSEGDQAKPLAFPSAAPSIPSHKLCAA